MNLTPLTPPLSDKQQRALTVAIERGRVTYLTASPLAIQALIKRGLLTGSDLAGVYIPTTEGLCVAGQCPF